MESNTTPTRVDTLDEKTKLNAAYALNLCTVSVSQIIDYNDLNVLEQEYENILNNLNLHNMPKDEALLRILKHILDTITYFRIAEGDKKMQEKAYQHKIKNAIWSSVPNLVSIIATGSPVAMAVSLATQIGVGYMNYRKEKAKISLEQEQKKWEMERSAIEQFNGLRRELFDTAWRLADRYDFDDEYRLTERQISQYDEILMDPDPLHRLERLQVMEEFFKAYPPFWYYIGNAANEVAEKLRNAQDSTNLLCQKYIEIAKSYFEKYVSIGHLNLLRENQIRSACCLEYVDLLKRERNYDKSKILDLLEDAIKHSGRKYDVLQICAIDYMQLEEWDKAKALFREMAINGYNQKSNSLLLCSLYLQDIKMKRMSYTEVKMLYETFKRLVPDYCIIPFPINEGDIEKVTVKFLEKEKENLIQKYGFAIDSFTNKSTIMQNREILCPKYDSSEYPDSFFLDSAEARKHRMFEFNKHVKWDQYRILLQDRGIGNVIEKNVNVLYQNLKSVLYTLTSTSQPKLEYGTIVNNILADTIKDRKVHFEKILDAINIEKLNSSHLESLNSLSIFSIFASSNYHLKKTIRDYISKIGDYSQINEVESALIAYCKEYDIEIPESNTFLGQTDSIFRDDYQFPILQYLGIDPTVEETKKYILHILRKYHEDGSLYLREDSPKLIIRGDSDFDAKHVFIDKKEELMRAHGQLLASLLDKNKYYLLFFADGVVYYSDSFTGDSIDATSSYQHVCVKSDVLMTGGKKLYGNKEKINIEQLFNCIRECKQVPKVPSSRASSIACSVASFGLMKALLSW